MALDPVYDSIALLRVRPNLSIHCRTVRSRHCRRRRQHVEPGENCRAMCRYRRGRASCLYAVVTRRSARTESLAPWRLLCRRRHQLHQPRAPARLTAWRSKAPPSLSGEYHRRFRRLPCAHRQVRAPYSPLLPIFTSGHTFPCFSSRPTAPVYLYRFGEHGDHRMLEPRLRDVFR